MELWVTLGDLGYIPILYNAAFFSADSSWRRRSRVYLYAFNECGGYCLDHVVGYMTC